MFTPLKSKLSYAWRRIARKNAIYSHTFERDRPLLDNSLPRYNLRGEFIDRPEVRTKEYRWLEALPVKGQHDAFRVTEHSYYRHNNFFRCISTKLSEHNEQYLGTFTRQDALNYIQKKENEYANYSASWQMKIKKRTPFKSRVETRFVKTSDGFNIAVKKNEANGQAAGALNQIAAQMVDKVKEQELERKEDAERRRRHHIDMMK